MLSVLSAPSLSPRGGWTNLEQDQHRKPVWLWVRMQLGTRQEVTCHMQTLAEEDGIRSEAMPVVESEFQHRPH